MQQKSCVSVWVCVSVCVCECVWVCVCVFSFQSHRIFRTCSPGLRFNKVNNFYCFKCILRWNWLLKNQLSTWKDRMQCSINDTIQWYSLMILFWFVLNINSFTWCYFGSICGNVNTVKKENNLLVLWKYFRLKGVSGILRVGQSTLWNLCFRGCALKTQSVLV